MRRLLLTLERLSGDTALVVTSDGRPSRTVDTVSYVTSAPATQDARGTRSAGVPNPASRGGGRPASVVVAAAAVLALVAAAALARRRGRLPVWRPRSD